MYRFGHEHPSHPLPALSAPPIVDHRMLYLQFYGSPQSYITRSQLKVKSCFPPLWKHCLLWLSMILLFGWMDIINIRPRLIPFVGLIPCRSTSFLMVPAL